MTNVILLKGDPIPKEYALMSSVDITPGMLCEITTTGKIRPHATAGGNASPLFAQQAFSNPERDIDDAYTADDEQVHALYCRRGDEIYALLATGNNVAIGALLESNGAGALRAYTAPDPDSDSGTIMESSAICRAKEAVNNSSGSNARIRVEVI